MTNILKHTERNISGLIPMWWVFASDVKTQTINKKTLACSITLNSGAKWNYLYGTNDTIELESEEVDKPAGTQYSYKIKCLIPKDRSAVEIALREMERRGIVLHVTDKNGVIRVYGTSENPMRKASKLKKPANVEGFNGWEVTFQGDFALPAFYGEELSTAVQNEITYDE
jgi:hypothetical protein